MNIRMYRWLVIVTLFVSMVPLEIRAQSSSNRVRSISWSQDNSKIAFSRNDGTIQIQNAATGQPLLSLQGDTTGATSVAFSLDANSTKLASGGADGIVKIWDSNTGSLLSSLAGHPNLIVSLAWNPINPNLLASVDWGGMIRVWNISTSALLFYTGDPGTTGDIDWSPDGSQLVTASGTGMILWDATTGARLSTIVPTHPEIDGEISTVDWGTNPNLLVSVTVSATMKTWNPSTGTAITTFTGYTSPIMDVQFSPDGSKIATAGYDNSIKMWNTSTGQLIQTIQTTYVTFAVAWSPDGKQLAFGGDNDVVQILPISAAPEATSTPDAGNIPTPQAAVTADN